MNAENSLRLLIDKWLTPTIATRVQVTRFSRSYPKRTRCVRVEALRPEGSIAIFFFQHDDGIWRVFPQETRRPTLHAYAIAERLKN
jgi:hypothetical protein